MGWWEHMTCDPLPCKNVCSLHGEHPKYEIGESVLGVCIWRPYKGRIAIVAGKTSIILQGIMIFLCRSICHL
jgi:hypothetical protein